ncbi:tRNA (adenosine(37)-N6)-dimethylallyltransferase MiaA [soil metagenome]
MSPFTDALILTGCTGSGKTALALDLAETLNAEIIALDSMTVYKGMNIGTAKPTWAEQDLVKHHLIDVLEPHESANVAWWLEKATAACEDIQARGKRPLFVGGTPMYLKALLYGLFESPPVDDAIRLRLEEEAAVIGPEAFHAKLAAVDAVAAGKIHPNNVRRVVRAMEVYEATGQPISTLQLTWDQPPAAIPAVMLDWPREVLNDRIDQRVTLMMEAGWLCECERLKKVTMSSEARQAVGYDVIFSYLRGERFEPDLDLIRQRTRQFAKRQLTWFRKLPVTPVDAGKPDTIDHVLHSFLVRAKS